MEEITTRPQYKLPWRFCVVTEILSSLLWPFIWWSLVSDTNAFNLHRQGFYVTYAAESWKVCTKGRVWTTLSAAAFQTQTLRDHWLYTATFMHETLSNFRSFRKLPKETEWERWKRRGCARVILLNDRALCPLLRPPLGMAQETLNNNEESGHWAAIANTENCRRAVSLISR